MDPRKFQKDLQTDEDIMVKAHRKQLSDMADSMRAQAINYRNELENKDRFIEEQGRKLGAAGAALEELKYARTCLREDLRFCGNDRMENEAYQLFYRRVDAALNKIVNGTRGDGYEK